MTFSVLRGYHVVHVPEGLKGRPRQTRSFLDVRHSRQAGKGKKVRSLQTHGGIESSVVSLLRPSEQRFQPLTAWG